MSDEQPSLNAIHEAGHLVMALLVGIKSLAASAKPGENHRGKWTGRVIYDPAEFKSLDPHQQRMTAVAGSVAGLIAQGLTPAFQVVVDGMSGADLEHCRTCGQAAFERAVDEVVDTFQTPEVWQKLLEAASWFDEFGVLALGKHAKMLQELG